MVNCRLEYAHTTPADTYTNMHHTHARTHMHTRTLTLPIHHNQDQILLWISYTFWPLTCTYLYLTLPLYYDESPQTGDLFWQKIQIVGEGYPTKCIN